MRRKDRELCFTTPPESGLWKVKAKEKKFLRHFWRQIRGIGCNLKSRRKGSKYQFKTFVVPKRVIPYLIRTFQGIEPWIFPGSDEEDNVEEREAKIAIKQTKYTAFRGKVGKPLAFTASAAFGGKYVYESLLILWLQAWSEQNNGDQVGIPAFDSPTTDIFLLDFFSHKDILLPLILKSIALRHGSSQAVLDSGHIDVLKKFVEMLAYFVMGEAMSELKTSASNSSDCNLLKALASADVILDFVSGLFAVLHSEHMRSLVDTFFSTLRACEQLKESKDGLAQVEWTVHSIQRAKSSRQIRLKACEKLAVLPSFLALNFPLKYSGHLDPVLSRGNESDSTWKMQYNKSGCEVSGEFNASTFQSKDNKLPRSGWLARRLTDEALSICALSCEAVVAEAIAQIEHANIGPKSSQEEAQRKSQLDRADLLLFQSSAIHSVTVVYELLMRRHAMDRRFQTETCRGRIAALYAECIFTHSLRGVRWLARLDSTHKVRSVWLLCLAYVLQEAPEVLIRGLVRSYCDPSVSALEDGQFCICSRLRPLTFVSPQRTSLFTGSFDFFDSEAQRSKALSTSLAIAHSQTKSMKAYRRGCNKRAFTVS